MTDITIRYKDKPLFQRAEFSLPTRYTSNLQDYSCFFYINKGSYQTIEANGIFKVGEKEALLKKCGNYISYFPSSEEQVYAEAIAVYFHTDIIKSIYSNEMVDFFNKSKERSTPKKLANELIEKYVNNLIVYLDNPSLIDEELAALKFKELILILMKSQHSDSIQTFFADLFNYQELEFKTIIENNIFNDISIEELAFICHKSLSSFKRLFKATFNETPARYIKRRRLEHAAQLISTSAENISHIACDCGFNDPTTFSAVFSNQFGVSPTTYRHQNRKDLTQKGK
ncbi:MAG: helix-turn-helix transcriptional regulator [Saprospiraceae bacterium]|nr:helix-turn-helix transcriptional regulator [Saprospiraceae bacterium]